VAVDAVTRLHNKGPLLWILLYAALSAFWYAWWRGDPRIAAENHAMETFQAGCLLGGIVLLANARRSTSDVAGRVFVLGLILFYFTILVLEVDTRKMDAPPWLVRVTNGTIRDVWLGSLWAIAAALFWRGQPPRILRRFFSWLPTAAGRLMLCAGVFWMAALIVEKVFRVSFFIEELLECQAALLMAHSAWLTLRRVRTEVSGRTG
jgi:hypothetical protein